MIKLKSFLIKRNNSIPIKTIRKNIANFNNYKINFALSNQNKNLNHNLNLNLKVSLFTLFHYTNKIIEVVRYKNNIRIVVLLVLICFLTNQTIRAQINFVRTNIEFW